MLFPTWAIIILWVRQTHRYLVSSTGTSISCEFDRHIDILQPSATSPLFFDNLHFEHFDKSVNHKSTLKYLSKCSKWRLSKKRGLVADGWYLVSSTDTSISCEFDRHIDILRVRQTHRHAYHHLVSSTYTSASCEFDRHMRMIRHLPFGSVAARFGFVKRRVASCTWD